MAPRAPSPLSLLVPLLLLLLLAPTGSLAFFEQFFGHQQHHQQQQPQGPPSFEDQLDRINCAHFVCPDFSCARAPADCPCPSRTDFKCPLPGGGADGAYVCARSCEKVEEAARGAFVY
ncbi:hypothetical protein JCM8097_007705 [Rhodosporidiobolus ruineniae]